MRHSHEILLSGNFGWRLYNRRSYTTGNRNSGNHEIRNVAANEREQKPKSSMRLSEINAKTPRPGGAEKRINGIQLLLSKKAR